MGSAGASQMAGRRRCWSREAAVLQAWCYRPRSCVEVAVGHWRVAAWRIRTTGACVSATLRLGSAAEGRQVGWQKGGPEMLRAVWSRGCKVSEQAVL